MRIFNWSIKRRESAYDAAARAEEVAKRTADVVLEHVDLLDAQAREIQNLRWRLQGYIDGSDIVHRAVGSALTELARRDFGIAEYIGRRFGS